MKIIVSKASTSLIILTLLGLVLFSVWYLIGKNNLTTKPVTTMSVTEATPENILNKNPIIEYQPAGSEFKHNYQNSTGFFIEYRLERERVRGQQVEWLREIINSANVDTNTRKQAQQELYLISKNIVKEMQLESLIQAKGVAYAIVILQDKAITVVVQSEELVDEQTTLIAELVAHNTEIPVSDIIIISKK